MRRGSLRENGGTYLGNFSGASKLRMVFHRVQGQIKKGLFRCLLTHSI